MKNFNIDFYNELLNIIQEVTHHIDHHALWQFLNSDQGHEFRLGGVFGMGFKLWRNDGRFYFNQYKEDETSNSIDWITRKNQYLMRLSEELLKEE